MLLGRYKISNPGRQGWVWKCQGYSWWKSESHGGGPCHHGMRVVHGWPTALFMTVRVGWWGHSPFRRSISWWLLGTLSWPFPLYHATSHTCFMLEHTRVLLSYLGPLFSFYFFWKCCWFFFLKPFFCIFSTSSPTWISNFSILVAHRTSSIQFQSVLEHLDMWPKK
jgi:hypothetical protein